MKTLNLYDFLENLKRTRYPDTQLDIYYSNVVIIQIFNSIDVINWGWKLHNLSEEGIVISLVFNDQKPNNSTNYNRFKGCNLYRLFEKKDMGGGDMYFYFMQESTDAQARLIVELLQNIYNIQGNEIEVYLNSYT